MESVNSRQHSDTANDEIDARPLENRGSVIVRDEEQVTDDENDSDQGADEAEGEEELRSHEERCGDDLETSQ